MRGGTRSARSSRKQAAPTAHPAKGKRKLIGFEPEVYDALALLARDRMQDFQELADEAFRDLLNKHGRPMTLRSALRKSVERPLPEPTKPRRKPAD
jgi:hypothetical protein